PRLALLPLLAVARGDLFDARAIEALAAHRVEDRVDPLHLAEAQSARRLPHLGGERPDLVFLLAVATELPHQPEHPTRPAEATAPAVAAEAVVAATTAAATKAPRDHLRRHQPARDTENDSWEHDRLLGLGFVPSF